MKKRGFPQRQAFTLIELLLVLAIIAFLTPVVLLALNPTKQLGRGRDTQRQSDINTILNAVYQYQIDTGTLPSTIPIGTAAQICKGTAASCNHGVNLRMLTGAYLVNIPTDPQAPATGTGTRYFIVRDADGRLTVTAPGGEQGSDISVTR